MATQSAPVSDGNVNTPSGEVSDDERLVAQHYAQNKLVLAQTDPSSVESRLQRARYGMNAFSDGRKLAYSMSVVGSSFRVLAKLCTNGQQLVTAALQAGTWMGRGLLVRYTGDADLSAWQCYEAESLPIMFPHVHDALDDDEPEYHVGEALFAFAYDRAVCSVLAQLWDYTDPAHGFQLPPKEAVTAAATRALTVMKSLVSHDTLRQVAAAQLQSSCPGAAVELTDAACEYVVSKCCMEHFSEDVFEEEGRDGATQLIAYLFSVRLLRMAIRRAKGVSHELVYDMMLKWPRNQVWMCGKWAATPRVGEKCGFRFDDYPLAEPSESSEAAIAAAEAAHPCRLPQLVSCLGPPFPLMYLMRYRVFTAELAWIRRVPALHLRRSIQAQFGSRRA